MSDFFEARPPPDPKARMPQPASGRIKVIRPPRGVLPAVVSAEQVLARTAEVMVSLSRLWVYPTGFTLDLFVDFDDEWSDLDPFQFGPSRKGKEVPAGSPDRLNFGFAFSDGSKATNVDGGRRMAAGTARGSCRLTGLGASSGGGHARSSFWLSPLPPPGPVAVVCEWQAANVPMTRCELDAEGIAAAAARSQVIFSDDDEASW